MLRGPGPARETSPGPPPLPGLTLRQDVPGWGFISPRSQGSGYWVCLFCPSPGSESVSGTPVLLLSWFLSCFAGSRSRATSLKGVLGCVTVSLLCPPAGYSVRLAVLPLGKLLPSEHGRSPHGPLHPVVEGPHTCLSFLLFSSLNLCIGLLCSRLFSHIFCLLFTFCFLGFLFKFFFGILYFSVSTFYL